MKATHLTPLFFLTLALAACNDSNNTAVPPQEPAAAATVAPPAPPPPAVDSLTRTVGSDHIALQSDVAKLESGELVSTGQPGFMMYGPYIPFQSGEYVIRVQGSILDLPNGAEVRFDVVSDTGNAVHAEHVVKTAPTISNVIAEFDATIPYGVQDLEVRAYVTEGAQTRIKSYSVSRRD